ncbi:apoptosis antagonizing transcription factor-domain-containing protein [Exophiala viscosa]|uniref:Protein BFR2 n=1 Tax=Exophiala viscosa TaxID=2486360 RepID=A0AAN6DLW1_9EURO|nr:apoptosis antagonizing transcription factor-domain-containing protein [Exophiala viscosa]
MGSLRKKGHDLELKGRKDFDPEDDSFRRLDEDDSEAEEDVNDDIGREHYEAVGKSVLREPAQPPTLDAKYGGVAVSRKALDEEDEDDPFAPLDESEEDDPFAARDEDADALNEVDDIPDNVDLEAEIDENSEIDSDEAFGESDQERFKDFKFRASKKNRIEAQSEDEISDEELEDNDTNDSEEVATDNTDLDMDDEDDEEEEEEEDDDSASSTGSPSKTARNADREELKKAAFSTAGLASALSAGANADVQKGKAVKQQRQTFDRLLDSRIKLQKGITAMNEITEITLTDDEIKEAAQQAEAAALALWSTIDAIRRTILSSSKPDSESDHSSRKRPFTATRSTSTEELWQQNSSFDADVHSVRRTTLDKWHAKTQPVIDTAPRSKLLGSSHSRSRLTDVLDTYLATESTKLSTASVPSPGTFDDGPFYQALLRDLIASRSANSTATTEPFLPTKLHVSGSKGKKVDTKASKGRKVRYTVHEKLENFMAPEDRSTWEDAARREFFASLFGNAGALDENTEEAEQGEDADGEAEVEALRLFRS